MGKSKLALHNPPRLMKEPGMMKISYVDHFPGRITSMCKLDVVVNVIREKLTRQQLKLFKDNIFGHFLQCRSYPFSGPSHTVSKFHILSLCYYDFKLEIMLICSSPRNNRPLMVMVRTLMLAMVRILMLVMTMSTPLCHCTVYMGTSVMTVYRYSQRHLPALVSLGVRTDQ